MATPADEENQNQRLPTAPYPALDLPNIPTFQADFPGQSMQGQGSGASNAFKDFQGGPAFLVPGGTAGPETSDFPGSIGWRDPNADQTNPLFDTPRFGPGGAITPREPAGLHQFQYTTQSPISTLSDMSPGSISVLQEQMVKAGFNVQITGSLANSPGTISALREVMGYANVTGMPWTEAMKRMVSDFQAFNQGVGQDVRQRSIRPTPVFTFDPYTPPDHDTVALNVEEAMKQQLGRDPEDWEMVALADYLTSLYASSYDQQLSAARQKFEQEVLAGEQAALQEEQMIDAQLEDIEGGGEGIGPGETVPDPIVMEPGETGPAVDIESSFIRHFREKYGAELERIEDLAEVMQDRELTLASILGMDQVIDSDAVNRF